MEVLDTFYDARPDRPLYHYSDANGILAILETKTLRATNIQFLNDSSEFGHALSMISEQIDEVWRTSKVGADKEMWLAAKEGVETMTPNTFVTSLSEEPDILSQWRGYCPKGGYNIEFDPNGISELAIQNGFVMVRCEYDERIQRRLVGALLNAAQHRFQSFAPPLSVDLGRVWTDREVGQHFFAFWFWNQIQRLASALKNSKFDEEREWRLIGGLKGDRKVAAGYRTKGSLIVPYQIFNLDREGFLDGIITGATIGPMANVELARHSLERLRHGRFRTAPFNVRSSKVPYRTFE